MQEREVWLEANSPLQLQIIVVLQKLMLAKSLNDSFLKIILGNTDCYFTRNLKPVCVEFEDF